MISVIIPTYRRYEMLKEAVNSVLEQTYQDVEIIVIDDCSNDESRMIKEISQKVVYLCNEKNCGPGYSRRRGLQCCHGKYVVFLDDDDYYTDPFFYANAVRVLESVKECSFVAGNAYVQHMSEDALLEDKLNVVGEMKASDYLEGFLSKYKKPHSTFTTIFRKSALFEAGADTMKMVNDVPIYMRCLSAGGIVYFMDDTIGVYRIHDGNISKAMSWDFICANLEEKYIVQERIKQMKLFDKIDPWWYTQIEITVSFFIYGSRPSLKDWNKARKWCVDHSSNKKDIERLFEKYKKYLVDCQICEWKSKIKKALGIK